LSAIAPLCPRLTMPLASIALVAVAMRSERAGYREEAATDITALTTGHEPRGYHRDDRRCARLLRVSKEGIEPARTTASAALLALGPQLFVTFTEPLLGSPLLYERLFWSDACIDLLRPKMHARNPQLLGALRSFYFELLHLCACAWLLLWRDGHAEPAAPATAVATAPAAAEAAATNAAPETTVAFAALPLDAVDAVTLRRVVEAISEVLDTFENEPETVAFFNGQTFFAEVASRSRRLLDDFGPFHMQHLPKFGKAGRRGAQPRARHAAGGAGVARTLPSVLALGAAGAMEVIFQKASKMAYNLKYAVMSVMMSVRSASGAVMSARSSSRETSRSSPSIWDPLSPDLERSRSWRERRLPELRKGGGTLSSSLFAPVDEMVCLARHLPC
jgi:hypothetical protein